MKDGAVEMPANPSRRAGRRGNEGRCRRSRGREQRGGRDQAREEA